MDSLFQEDSFNLSLHLRINHHLWFLFYCIGLEWESIDKQSLSLSFLNFLAIFLSHQTRINCHSLSGPWLESRRMDKGCFLVVIISFWYCITMASCSSTSDDVSSSSLDSSASDSSPREECRLRPIIHQLKYPGCIPKSIPSFACQGQCSSYVQVSQRIFSCEQFFP